LVSLLGLSEENTTTKEGLLFFLRCFDVVLDILRDECEHDGGEKENISTIDAADTRAFIKVYVVIRFIFFFLSFSSGDAKSMVDCPYC
jgi:hypothetical protein